jgi:hypothetical protein
MDGVNIGQADQPVGDGLEYRGPDQVLAEVADVPGWLVGKANGGKHGLRRSRGHELSVATSACWRARVLRLTDSASQTKLATATIAPGQKP